MNAPALSRQTLRRLTALFERETGIHLGVPKTTLIVTRLAPRLRALELSSFEQYCDALEQGAPVDELQCFIDRLTTNETYFFREPEHFRYLAERVRADLRTPPLRVWSAACSSGEELFSTAMVIDEARSLAGVELVGSDISHTVLQRAARGIYPDTRLQNVSKPLLHRYFLRGTGQQQGYVRVVPALRSHAQFTQHNLMHSPGKLGRFDVIWLRNVLIYFEVPAKQRILELVTSALRPGGLLFVGLAESLNGHKLPLQAIGRSIYERVHAVQRVQSKPRGATR